MQAVGNLAGDTRALAIQELTVGADTVTVAIQNEWAIASAGGCIHGEVSSLVHEANILVVGC